MPKLIGFSWSRCKAGYGLERREGLPPDPSRTLLQDALAGPEERIVPLSAESESYRPLERFEALYGIFAKVQETGGALDFVRKFGLVFSPKGDSVDEILQSAKIMRRVLAMRDKEQLAENISGLKLAPVGVSIVWDALSQKFQFQFTPRNLNDAMWFQLAQTIAGGCAISECRFCNAWFPAGPGTERRLDAEFCSKAHKIAFHSLKRGKKPTAPKKPGKKKPRKS